MKKINIWIALVLSLILMIGIGYIFDFIKTYFHIVIPQVGIEEMSPIGQFATAVLLAPILETLLAQYLPIYLLRKVTKSDLILTLSSAILFSVMHYYHWLYMFVMFFGGLILASFYLYSEKQKVSPIWMTILLHALYNLCVFCANIQN